MIARLAPWPASKRTSSEASVRPPAVVARRPYQPVSSTGQSAWRWTGTPDSACQAQPGPYSPPRPVTGTFPEVRLSPSSGVKRRTTRPSLSSSTDSSRSPGATVTIRWAKKARRSST